MLVPLLPLLAACPGSLSFDYVPPSGNGGDNGVGGDVGGGGASGAGGTTGNIPLSCSNAQTVLQTSCATCHSNPPQPIYANLNLATTASMNALVGQVAYTGASGECGGMGLFVLNKGTLPATGILIDKITGNPHCGMSMPQPPLPALSSTDQACLQAWANGLVSAAGTN